MLLSLLVTVTLIQCKPLISNVEDDQIIKSGTDVNDEAAVQQSDYLRTVRRDTLSDNNDQTINQQAEFQRAGRGISFPFCNTFPFFISYQ